MSEIKIEKIKVEVFYRIASSDTEKTTITLFKDEEELLIQDLEERNEHGIGFLQSTIAHMVDARFDDVTIEDYSLEEAMKNFRMNKKEG